MPGDDPARLAEPAIFWPMIAHVALVYGVYALMALRRKRAVETGSAKISQFRENRDEPAESLFVHVDLKERKSAPPTRASAPYPQLPASAMP